MKMSLVVDGLRADVAAVGELGDDVVADVAERIAGVLTRSVPGWVLDLLSEATAELSSELPGGRVEIRVTGDDVDLTYVADEPAPAGEDDGDLSARITLRLAEGLKTRVEQGAGEEGVSVNTYILRTLERGTAQRARNSGGSRGGTRLRGYGVT
ncbi:MAG TPA: toxin-antitoxin system HicB family antitoxin [Acidimicrobiales bacterium]|nr:toxin-antitoxin system HicB family antitoxin [Acidimicrobiales bacterium]